MCGSTHRGGGAEADSLWTADCNHGPDIVPEYAFQLVTPEGEIETLRDYAEEPSFVYDLPEDYDLRVLARPKGTDDAPQYYDYPSDYVHRLD